MSRARAHAVSDRDWTLWSVGLLGVSVAGLAAVIIAVVLLLVHVAASLAAEDGIASKYWQPQGLACGGRLNTSALTAAHKTLPCGSRVRVINKSNGRSVVVTINDRGPFVRGRVIDLTPAGASAIGMGGLAPVKVERIK